MHKLPVKKISYFVVIFISKNHKIDDDRNEIKSVFILSIFFCLKKFFVVVVRGISCSFDSQQTIKHNLLWLEKGLTQLRKSETFVCLCVRQSPIGAHANANATDDIMLIVFKWSYTSFVAYVFFTSFASQQKLKMTNEVNDCRWQFSSLFFSLKSVFKITFNDFLIGFSCCEIENIYFFLFSFTENRNVLVDQSIKFDRT